MDRPPGFGAPPRLRRGLLLLCAGAALLAAAAMRARVVADQAAGSATPSGTPAR